MTDKKSDIGGYDNTTQDVVKTLKEILEEFRKQGQTSTPPPLSADAQKAVDAFKEITNALGVKPT